MILGQQFGDASLGDWNPANGPMKAIEALIWLLRGGDGLDLPPGPVAAANRVANRVVARWTAGQFPAITADDFRILNAIARLPGPSRR